jgi:predicted TIM-barrel fold metal-dependent hydrolase
MLIVDAQVHIWAADTPERPWPGHHKPHQPQPMGRDELWRAMQGAGVDRAVLVPPTWEGIRNDLALAAAQAHPDRFAVTGLYDLHASAARASIAGWMNQPGMLGMRIQFTRPPERSLLTERRLDGLWREAEAACIPMMLSVQPGDVGEIDAIAQHHPRLKLTLDRCALAIEQQDEQAFVAIDKLLALAQHPNVALKATCLPSYTADSYPFRRLHPYLKRIVDAFGARRIFWGSDLSRLPCSYRECVTMFTEEMPWLSSADLEWIMGRALCEWLGWK